MRFVTRRLFRPVTVCLAAAAAGCDRAPRPDAYGNVEATEVVVGAQGNGQLLWFTPTDGARLAAGAQVGVIDTTALALQLRQIEAQRAASASRRTEVVQQVGVLAVQREIAGRTYARTRRLFDQKAATAQQLDQAERDYRVLGEQIAATRAQQRSAGEDVASGEARVGQVREQIRRSVVTNPLAGTVLATYARAGEVVAPGQPLYRIANLDAVEVRAYVQEPLLARLRIGGPAQVSVDVGRRERRTLAGTVAWIASEAEFTPTPIQTRDERGNLVYAVKISVPNRGGILKVGMPADVRFTAAPAAR